MYYTLHDDLTEYLQKPGLPDDVRRDLQAMLDDRQPPQDNRYFEGEEKRPGSYKDDNGTETWLNVTQDSQGDVWFSIQTKGQQMLSVRMVGHCSRRPHVLIRARRLAQSLLPDTPQTITPAQTTPRKP